MRLLMAVLCGVFLSACTDSDSVSTGIFSATTIDVEAFNDPQISGITCHVSSVKAHLSFSDPSNMAIACRQTGALPADLQDKINLEEPQHVFRDSKSILFKSLKVRRTFDAKNQTIIYLAYSTKETSGSFKNSVSTVPLFGTDAYRNIQ
ncbi:MAG: CreA family protein [Alteromonadaceae bacterium]|nr:CreA family protein [Alteromonadaceae bacterium]